MRSQGRLVALLTRHQRLLAGASSFRRLATAVNRPKLPFDETCSSVTPPYSKLVQNLETVKRILDNEPLTLAEKILYSHLDNAEDSLAAGKGNIRGQSYLKLNPDRVAMQGQNSRSSKY
jgi:homoaconitase